MRIVPARNGGLWLIRGFALFGRSPGVWLLVVLAMALPGQIPYLGPVLSTILLPAFTVSFMVMCAALDRGGVVRPGHLWSGFHGRLPTLIFLGVLYLLSIAAVLALASAIDAGALLRWLLIGEEPSPEAIRSGSVSHALLLTTVVSTPVMMAFWFAPVLAAWNGMSALKALFYSFFAGWRNWRAFLVYSAALALAGIAFLLLFAAAVVASRGAVETLRLLASTFILLSLPTVFASFYASYRDVFPENRIPGEAG